MAKKKKENPAETEKPVAFIEDPFGIKTLEISQAQNSEELQEEPLEEQLEAENYDLTAADEAQLEQIAQAVSDQSAQDVAGMESQVESAEDTAKRLAEQIAEDQALAQELAREAAEAEKMEEQDEELKAALPKLGENGDLDVNEVESCIEAILFMMDKPISMNKLREHLSNGGEPAPMSVFQEAMTRLKDRYLLSHHGIEVAEVNGGYQLRTKPIRAALAKKLSKVQTQRLSTGAMESLAIIAYRQPVMKEEIDQIRGVDSSYFIRGLLDKRLIRISGRSELPGRPMLYSTTDEFLEIFGLKDLSSMPALRELEAMIPTSETGPEDEDPRVKQMRQLVAQMKADGSTNLNYDPREDEQILKDIRERVNSIPTSTPYLEEQKAAEKAAELAAQNPELAAAAGGILQPELPVATPEAADVPPPVLTDSTSELSAEAAQWAPDSQ